MKNKIYIAGPMSGHPEFNFPAFFRAQRSLEEGGWIVFNPANKDVERTLSEDAMASGDHIKAIEEGFDFREAFAWDIQCILESDAIYMLKGWEQSPGARAEHATATVLQKHYPEFEIIYE